MSIGKVKEFDIKSGVWSSYVERLEMYFTVNNVKSDLKLPTLIAVMGDEAYELLVNLSSPKKPSELKYEDAIELLRRHLQPAPSVLAERFRFRQRRQAADENIASYVAELKKLTRHCKLGDNLNENLRDQFVCGLRSDLIRQRLFAEEETISFANAVKLANSLEAAERDAAAVDTVGAAEAAGAARGADGAAAAALHTMAGTENGRWRRSAARARSVQDQSAARNGAGARTRSSVKGTGYRCKGCTSTLHSYEACRFRDYVCSRCQSRGHIRRACVQKAGAGSGRFNAVHYGDAEGIASEEEMESDFHHLGLNDYKAVSLPVLIDNVEVKMEVDTGTAVSYKELFSGGLGRYSGGKATLRVREGATPVFHRARALPYALRDRVDAELDAMLRDGVIEPVDCSDWASPLVPECERAFKEVKTLLTSAEVLSHYDPARPLIVTCDASAKGIGAVLSQPSRNGDCERPVAYASRTLNDAEKNYSQIHREALAIIFSVHKFHQYLYGRHFTLRTDHKPLVSIFGPHTGIPTMVASRMQRWAIILSAYTFDIEYVRTDKNGADGLSRLPMTGKQLTARQVPEQTYLHFIQEALLLDYNEIKKHTTRDPDLSKILSYLRDGWPTENSITNLQPYFNRKNELYEELGCVMWGHRLVVPETCRDRVLKMIHEPHMGIVKSKSLARSYVWWPSLDESIQRVCQGCEVCAAQADAPPKQAVRMWPWPNRPWSRIHLDFMGPIFGKTYLVIVDATSKWIEVFQVPNTASTVVIDRLTELFSRFGLAKQIITDNASYFASTEFRNFTQSNGIEHIFTAPYHPASNGLAENAVRTLKRVIKKAVSERQNVDRALWTFLMHYRNTEHSTTGECPAMLLLGRRLRTKLDALKPDRERKVAKVQQHQREMAKGVEREVKPEDEVWYRQYLKREKWVPGQVVECTGPSNYKVRGQDGDLVHRHIDQLKKRSTRFSLACPTTSLNQESSTDPQSPAALSEQVQPERSTRGDIEAPVTPGSSTGSDKVHTNTPASPEFQDAVESNESPAQTRRRSTSPAHAITPEPRPLRQCRIRKPFNKL
ncbi:uncharacterized protein LOC123878463 [Maniola jurtina]|uniref:uncharacterized protein LOC123878463 n=1 Tax=Maniola jurtina TaxID=191418 RepID=UPI001E68A011|nr:uncharacterized protein LOC123878463 [Maniola jurtina]